MSEEQAVDVKALVERIEKLEARCENFAQAHLDNHEDMRDFAERINAFETKIHSVVNEVISGLQRDFDRNAEYAKANLQKTLAETKATLAEALSTAVAQVKPEQIADALTGAGRIVVTRPASREEMKSGVGVVVTRQAGRRE
jgi:hypothetical protein